MVLYPEESDGPAFDAIADGRDHLLIGAGQISLVTAQTATSWDGTWTGFWGGISATSVTIVGGRISRYEFKEKSVPITISEVQENTVTFGVAGNYEVRIIKTSQNTATATYENFTNNDIAVADLTLAAGVATPNSASASPQSICDPVATNTAGPMKCLPVFQIRQETNLCVPTSAAMVLTYYGHLHSPREIKTLASGHVYDPNDPFTDFTMTYFSSLIRGLARLGIHWSEKDYPNNEDGFADGLTEIEAQIDFGHPVLVDTGLSASGHTFVISGYIQPERRLLVVDPDAPPPGYRQSHSTTSSGFGIRKPSELTSGQQCLLNRRTER